MELGNARITSTKAVSNSAYLKQFGLYAVDNFIGRDLCEELTKEVRLAENDGIQCLGNEELDDPQNREFRPFVTDKLESGKLSIIEDKIISIKPDLEAHFEQNLTSAQAPLVGVYDVGSFSAKHVDAVEGQTEYRGVKAKKLTIVLFLNDESDEDLEDAYQGGKLTFYDIVDTPPFNQFGLPVKGKAGTIVIFPATNLHEVTPITRGKRFMVNSGYY